MSRLAVPAYFHPAYYPDAWPTLAALAPQLAFAILNPASGPGRAVDRAYLDPIAAVQSASRVAGRVAGRNPNVVIGYVDTAYGLRSFADVLDDLTAYQSWYGLRGAFLDQVSSQRDHLAHYRRIAASARRMGVDYLVLNPGVAPDPGYAEFADVTVTFEGPWSAYRDLAVAHWTRRLPPERFCHLVHSTPPEELAEVFDGAPERHAGAVYATELTGANPWGSLSAHLRHCADVATH